MAPSTLWVAKLRKAKKSCMQSSGRKKIHFTFDDGVEMVEEWNIKADTLHTRKWRKPSTLGRASPWDYEVGEGDAAPAAPAESGFGMAASSANPVCIRRDDKANFQWRIRNLPYKLDVYSLSVNDETQEMVLRTANKKYFKKLVIPDLERAGLEMDVELASMAHANNTLIISYEKPPSFVVFENVLKAERDKMKAAEDGDVDCTTQ